MIVRLSSPSLSVVVVSVVVVAPVFVTSVGVGCVIVLDDQRVAALGVGGVVAEAILKDGAFGFGDCEVGLIGVWEMRGGKEG